MHTEGPKLILIWFLARLVDGWAMSEYLCIVFTYTQHRQKNRFMQLNPSMCWERKKKIENCFEHVRVFLTVYEPLRAVTVAHSHYSVPILWRDIVLFQCCSTSETLKKNYKERKLKQKQKISNLYRDVVVTSDHFAYRIYYKSNEDLFNSKLDFLVTRIFVWKSFLYIYDTYWVKFLSFLPIQIEYRRAFS